MSLKIIKEDDSVKSLNNEQTVMLESFFYLNHFDLKNNVYLFETIKGHIATFQKKTGTFNKLTADHPARLTQNDLRVLVAISEYTRWIEVKNGSITIAF